MLIINTFNINMSFFFEITETETDFNVDKKYKTPSGMVLSSLFYSIPKNNKLILDEYNSLMEKNDDYVFTFESTPNDSGDYFKFNVSKNDYKQVYEKIIELHKMN